jgi:hypothetical protein
MSNFVHNERVKMAANLFNNLAVVSLATGFVVPLISAFLVPPSATPVVIENGRAYYGGQLPINVFGAVALVFVSFVVCSTIAQIILKDLKE